MSGIGIWRVPTTRGTYVVPGATPAEAVNRVVATFPAHLTVWQIVRGEVREVTP